VAVALERGLLGPANQPPAGLVAARKRAISYSRQARSLCVRKHVCGLRVVEEREVALVILCWGSRGRLEQRRCDGHEQHRDRD
jgi:hypothetical protein